MKKLLVMIGLMLAILAAPSVFAYGGYDGGYRGGEPRIHCSDLRSDRDYYACKEFKAERRERREERRDCYYPPPPPYGYDGSHHRR